MRNNNAKRLCLCALFCCILAALSQIALPLPFGVALTLQTFGVALAGFCLGHYSVIAVAVYIALGAVGLPVFSRFTAGVGVLAGVSGGFIFGFLLLSLLCGCAKGKRCATRLLMGISGLAACHIIGILQFSFISGNNYLQSFIISSLPFLLKDVICIAAAAFLAESLKNRIKI